MMMGALGRGKTGSAVEDERRPYVHSLYLGPAFAAPRIVHVHLLRRQHFSGRAALPLCAAYDVGVGAGAI